MFIEELALPEDGETRDGLPVTLTHKAIGATIQPWSDPPIQTYVNKGTMVRGRYMPITPDVYTSIRGGDFQTCQAAGDAFSLGALKAKVGEVMGRAGVVLFWNAARTMASSPDGLHSAIDEVGGYTYVNNNVWYNGVRRLPDDSFEVVQS